MSLYAEFSHMTNNHMRKDMTPTPDPIPAPPPVAEKPVLKIRRLSGDKLSVTTIEVPPPNLQISQVQSLAAPVTLTIAPMPEMSIKISSVASGPANVQELTSPTFKISNVVSLAEPKTQSPPSNATTPQPMVVEVATTNSDSGRMLKPWTNSVTRKSADICNAMLHQLCLYSLFKCMANDCQFSNSSAETMLQHLRYHEVRTMVAPGQKASWLECSYCVERFARNDQLVQHVLNEHSTSIFQCPHCFYRSCAAHNVLLHIRLLHHKMEQFVLVCRGKAKMLQSELQSIFAARMKNVRPIPCKKGSFC